MVPGAEGFGEGSPIIVIPIPDHHCPVAYSDLTPGITQTYNRLGRLSTTLANSITTTFAYNNAGQTLSEVYSGTFAGLAITNSYDAFLRRSKLVLNGPLGLISSTDYGYDAASRLRGVTNGVYSASYSYIANSPLVGQITFNQNGSTRMTTTKQYDNLNRLMQISSLPSGTGVMPVVFNYDYNLANQRTRNTLADGSYWIYQYDALG